MGKIEISDMFKLPQYLLNIRKYKKSALYGIDIPIELSIEKDDLVLDIGGGSNPVIKSNIVVEKYIKYKNRPLPFIDH